MNKKIKKKTLEISGCALPEYQLQPRPDMKSTLESQTQVKLMISKMCHAVGG